MSMREYAVNDYGLLVTEEMLKTIASKVCEDYTEDEYKAETWYFNYSLYERGIIEYIGDFTGESLEIANTGQAVWDSGETYNCDYVYYVPISNYPSLFNAAYTNMNELVSEFKEKLREYLPDDFDYRNHIRHIVGTSFG